MRKTVSRSLLIIWSAVRLSESESKHRSGSGNASCLIMRIEEMSLYIVYSEKCVKMSFHVIHSFTELAFGKPERDLRPALHNRTPMTSYVPGFEYISRNCVGGFRFIFLVCSHDNVNGLQTSETDDPVGHGSFPKLASYVDVPVHERLTRS